MNNESLIRLYILLVLLLGGVFPLFATQEEDRAFVTVSLPHFSSPDEVVGYVSDSPIGDHREIRGVLLEAASGEDEKRLVWGAFLPSAMDELKTVVVLVKDSDGKKHFFEFRGDEFHFYAPQGADEVRERIGLLREQIDQSKKEKEGLEKALHRLEQDAHLIGGFEVVEQLEKERDLEERELKRIRSQVDQLKRSIDTLKRWEAPSDLSERKRVFIRDIQELQRKRGT